MLQLFGKGTYVLQYSVWGVAVALDDLEAAVSPKGVDIFRDKLICRVENMDRGFVVLDSISLDSSLKVFAEYFAALMFTAIAFMMKEILPSPKHCGQYDGSTVLRFARQCRRLV